MRPCEISPSDIAAAMCVSVDSVWRWARNSRLLYKPPRQITVKGKDREIEAPHPWAKKMLRRLHRYLQAHCPAHKNAHGGVRGRSCFTAAKKHLGKNYVVTRDITNCFPSVSRENVKTRLQALGFRHDTAAMLAGISTVDDHLPQGSPISSDILNLVLHDADERLSLHLEPEGMRLHRCYDDFVVSTDSRQGAEKAGKLIEEEIEAHGLEVSEKKKLKNGHVRRNSRQLVHNLDVSNPAGIAIKKEDRRKVEALAESYVRGARSVSADSLVGLARKRAKLVGYICHFQQAQISNVDHLRKLLKHGDRFVSQALFCVQLDSVQWYVSQGGIHRPTVLSRAWRRRLLVKAA